MVYGRPMRRGVVLWGVVAGVMFAACGRTEIETLADGGTDAGICPTTCMSSQGKSCTLVMIDRNGVTECKCYCVS